jgi:hypothetical protein
MMRRLLALTVGLSAVLLTAGLSSLAAGPGAAASTDASGRPGSGELSATALEVNGATWDPDFADAAVPGLLRGAGVGLVRWPGGRRPAPTTGGPTSRAGT